MDEQIRYVVQIRNFTLGTWETVQGFTDLSDPERGRRKATERLASERTESPMHFYRLIEERTTVIDTGE